MIPKSKIDPWEKVAPSKVDAQREADLEDLVVW